MSTALPPLIVSPMTNAHLRAVYAIESICQEDPWSMGNFSDAIQANYQTQLLTHSENSDIIGYYVAMKGVDETHLLNINVAPLYQRRGVGSYLLELLKLWSMAEKAQWIWLEVREHNRPAIGLYEHFGFQVVGDRKNYYLKSDGSKENALLMNLELLP